MTARILAAGVPLLPLAAAGSLLGNNAVVMWLLGLAGVAVIFNQLAQAYKTLTKGMKEYPPPAQTYTTKVDCASKHNLINAKFSELKTREEGRDRVQEQRVTAIHNRINEVLAGVSELRGEVRQMNTRG